MERFYLKKLTANELGYRKGKLTNGQMFYISKQAVHFFPPLSAEINNDTAVLEFKVEYQELPVFLNIVYHNDKFNRAGGTRDEYRIYLNRDIAPDDFYFRPGDIVVIERLHESKYKLTRVREGESGYQELNKEISRSKIRGQHALLDDFE